MPEKDIVDNINIDLQKEVDIKVSSENKTSKLEEIAIFYNYENYAFLSFHEKLLLLEEVFYQLLFLLLEPLCVYLIVIKSKKEI